MKTMKFKEVPHGQSFYYDGKKFLRIQNSFVQDEFDVGSPNAMWMDTNWWGEKWFGYLCHFFAEDEVQVKERRHHEHS